MSPATFDRIMAVNARHVPPAVGASGGRAAEPWSAAELSNTLGRCGQPEEIARAVNFRLEPASWMTGQTLHVDGGFPAGGLLARPEET